MFPFTPNARTAIQLHVIINENILYEQFILFPRPISTWIPPPMNIPIYISRSKTIMPVHLLVQLASSFEPVPKAVPLFRATKKPKIVELSILLITSNKLAPAQPEQEGSERSRLKACGLPFPAGGPPLICVSPRSRTLRAQYTMTGHLCFPTAPELPDIDSEFGPFYTSCFLSSTIMRCSYQESQVQICGRCNVTASSGVLAVIYSFCIGGLG